MARFKTFANGGSLLPTDLNSIEDDYELAFSTYKTIGRFAAGGLNIGGFVGYLSYNSQAPTLTFDVPSPQHVFYLDPADYAVTGRTTKLRIKARITVNQVAPGTNLQVALCPVTEHYGASATANNYTDAINAATIGANFATPAASSSVVVTGGESTFPAAGLWDLGVWGTNLLGSGVSVAANCRVDIYAELQVRTV